MTNIEKHLEELSKTRISTIVRTEESENAYKIVKASYLGGIRFVEITLTVNDAFNLIKRCSEDFPDLNIGAGTVMTVSEAEKAIEFGAKYIVSPAACIDVLKWCNERDILCACGAVTPTEFGLLYINGAKLIKFYPATSMPMNYIGIIKNPYPNVKILATGGINKDNAKKFIDAGAFAVGVTEELGGAKNDTSLEEVTKIAKEYIEIIKK